MANDLRGEIIPGSISLGMKIHAYEFDEYWKEMRSIEAFYHANMESTKRTSNAHNFFERDSPLYTLPQHLPPTLITDAAITDSVVGDGCVLNGCKIKGTVVDMRTRVGEGTTIGDSIIMGSDTYPGRSSASLGDTPMHWIWKSIQESRFSEVAEQLNVCWLDFRCKMNTKMLSLKTNYAAYVAFKIEDNSFGLDAVLKTSVKFSDNRSNGDESDSVYFTTTKYGHELRGRRRRKVTVRRDHGRFPQKRIDGWMEILPGGVFQ